MPSEPMAGMPAQLLERVRDACRNRTAVLIADAPPCPLPEWISAAWSCDEALAAPRPEARRACGVLLTPWVAPGRRDAVIAHLRDFLSLELYVLHPGDAARQAREMGALGLRCLEVLRDDDGQAWGLNHFSLKTYKKTPGWLSSRDWANPQLWNKFRW